MSHKSYNRILLIPLGSLFAVFTALALWVQPIEGDLTRLGGFTENDFGWNEPQQQFSSALFKLTGERKYDRYYDVVVLGDSFSNANPRAQWQNYFVRATGLSLVTYKIDDIDIESFVTSPTYTDHPPRIVIYETVERSLISRGTIWNNGDCEPATFPYSKSEPLELKLHLKNQPTFPHSRDTRTGLSHPNWSSGVHFLKRFIKKTFNKKNHRAVKIPLNRTNLFSSKKSDYLLIYKGDFDRYQATEEQLNQAICGLTHIQNTFQQNSKTYFLVMVAPDKLTAYQELITNYNRSKLNWTTEVAKYQGLHLPRLDLALKSKINQGVRDIYLPNDTHWGSAGMQIAADTLYKYLLGQGVLINKLSSK